MKRHCFLFIIIFLVSFIPICFSAGMVFALDQVEINTASLQQLDEITGIGPVIAQRIIDTRPFSSVDDLLRVKGIGPKTLQKIKDQGLAYISENPNDQIPNPKSQTPNTQITAQKPTPTATYNKTSSGWAQEETLIPNSKNIVSTKTKETSKETAEIKNNGLDKEKLLASLNQSNNQKSGFKNTFFIAVGIIALSTIIFYYSKRFLIKNANPSSIF